MRTVAPVAFAAISGVILWKLFAMVLLPVVGILVGLVATAAKVAILVAIGFFVLSLIRKRRESVEA